MNERNNHDDASTTPATDEGEYTDVETEDGRTTHKDDVTPGEYTDVETEDGRTTHQDDVTPGEYTDTDLGEGTTH